MYGYAGTSLPATQLTPFAPPPPVTDPAGSLTQSGAVVSAAENATAVQSTTLPTALADPPSISPSMLATLISIPFRVPKIVNTALSFSSAGFSGRSILIQNERLAFLAAQDAEKSQAGLLVSTGPGGSPVTAGMGRASLVGSLSAPPNWATAAPEFQQVALALPDCGVSADAEMPQIPGSEFSQSVLGTLSRHGYDGPRPKSKPVIVRSPAAG
jgi:PPE-repeat protein